MLFRSASFRFARHSPESGTRLEDTTKGPAGRCRVVHTVIQPPDDGPRAPKSAAVPQPQFANCQPEVLGHYPRRYMIRSRKHYWALILTLLSPCSRHNSFLLPSGTHDCSSQPSKALVHIRILYSSQQSGPILAGRCRGIYCDVASSKRMECMKHRPPRTIVAGSYNLDTYHGTHLSAHPHPPVIVQRRYMLDVLASRELNPLSSSLSCCRDAKVHSPCSACVLKMMAPTSRLRFCDF